MKIEATIAFALLSLSLVRPLAAQVGVEFGLPVLFVHGFCDEPLNFKPAETALKTSLQGAYPSDYSKLSSPEEYVAFYDGTDVRFQVPGSSEFTPKEQINQQTRFFLIDFNDGTVAGKTYQQIDENSKQVAQISIFNKAQELAHIVWAIKIITGAPRVVIVSHSMGGLVSRAYIENLSIPSDSSHASAPYENDIATLVTLDTPHGGVEEAKWPLAWFSNDRASCVTETSVNKDEMTPSGSASIIPRINYDTPPSNFQPTSLPNALSITSIVSTWDSTGDDGLLSVVIPPGIPVWVPLLNADTQNLPQNINNPSTNLLSVVENVSNLFLLPFPSEDEPLELCGVIPKVLHFLDCTGSASQTFTKISDAVSKPFPPIATSRFMQISPTSWNIDAQSTLELSTVTPSGAPAIWSILEGGDGGSITQNGDNTATYTPPTKIGPSPKTFHVIAFDSVHWTQYAEATVRVVPNSQNGIVNTQPATAITSYGATLNGSVNSEGVEGSAYFQFSPDPSLTHNVTTTPNVGLIANNTVQPVSVNTSTWGGLASHTIYYYRAVFVSDSNSQITIGPILKFITLLTPVTATPAFDVSSFGAILNATINTNGAIGSGYFIFGTDPALGSNSNTTISTALTASNDPQVVSLSTTTWGSLPSHTTYYYRPVFVNASNGETTHGERQQFTTRGTFAKTSAATGITSFSATLNGIVNAGGAIATAYVQFGPDPTLAGNENLTIIYGPTRIDATSNVSISSEFGTTGRIDLASGKTYYFRIILVNKGNGETDYGEILPFTTSIVLVKTGQATGITSSSATLNTTVNPKGALGGVSFQFSTNPVLVANPFPSPTNQQWSTSETLVARSGSPQTYSISTTACANSLPGCPPGRVLTSGTTYYFRAVYFNSDNGETLYGLVQQFTTKK